MRVIDTVLALPAAVGVVERGSVMVLVTVGPEAELLDRRQIDLVEPGTSTHPHHHEGSWAVGRYLGTPGARPLPLSDAVALVEQVQAGAIARATAALAALAAAVPSRIGQIAIRACPPLPQTVQGRILDHRAQTIADSVMYREAMAEAARRRGWSVRWYDRERVPLDAAAALRGANLVAHLKAMGESAGPPWQAAHRLAASAALAALPASPRTANLP